MPPEIAALRDTEKQYAEYLRYLQRMFSRQHEDDSVNDEDSHREKRPSQSGYLKFVAEHYEPKHPHLRRLAGWKLAPALLEAVDRLEQLHIRVESSDAETRRQHEEKVWRTAVTEVFPNVYALPVLSQTTCEEIIEEMEHFFAFCESRKLAIFRPNSMNNYGAILDDFGFRAVLDELMKGYVQKLSTVFYPRIPRLDAHHGFIVSYEEQKDVSLDFHVDNAEVTLNICLGKAFTGSSLYFGGIRCREHQQDAPAKEESFTFEHELGVGVLHLGQHRHSAKPLKSGERHNLILWCQSSEFRKSDERLLCWEQCGHLVWK